MLFCLNQIETFSPNFSVFVTEPNQYAGGPDEVGEVRAAPPPYRPAKWFCRPLRSRAAYNGAPLSGAPFYGVPFNDVHPMFNVVLMVHHFSSFNDVSLMAVFHGCLLRTPVDRPALRGGPAAGEGRAPEEQHLRGELAQGRGPLPRRN